MMTTTTNKVAFVASFVGLSLLGVLFLTTYWSIKGIETVGMARAGFFVFVMAILHRIAYRSYARERTSTKSETTKPATPWTPAERIRLIICLLLSAPFFYLSVDEFIAGFKVREEIIRSGRSLDSVLPTMLSEHPAKGAVSACIALILVLIGRRNESKMDP